MIFNRFHHSASHAVWSPVTEASVGHSESPAGLVGLMAAATACARDAFLPGVPHLRECNPHVRAVLDASASSSVVIKDSRAVFFAPKFPLKFPD